MDAAIRDLHAGLHAETARRNPVCGLSGRCCDFDAYGHRLYVTGLEIAWAITQLIDQREGAAGALSLAVPAGGCVFQVGRLCGIHAVRPLGCRVFFCEPGTEEWQHALYERFLADLRRLHEREAVAYEYMEWRAGLAEAKLAVVGPSEQAD